MGIKHFMSRASMPRLRGWMWAALVAALALAWTPQAWSQVTVNAPSGLLNRKQEPKKQPQEPPKKQQEPVQKQEPATPSSGAATTQPLPEEQPAHTPAAPVEQRKPAKPSDYHMSEQQLVESHIGGYRIQVFFSSAKGAKSSAQKRAKQVALKFPQYRCYISYVAPQWRLRIGDFQSRETARRAMARIKRAFPAFARQVVLVRDYINIYEDNSATE